MSKHNVSSSTTSTSTAPTATTASKAPKRNATKPAPVLSRAGATIGTSTAVDATTMAVPTVGTSPPMPTASSPPTNPTPVPVPGALVQTTAPAPITPAPITSTTPADPSAPATPAPVDGLGAATGTTISTVTPGPIDPTPIPTVAAAPTVSIPVPPAGYVPVPASELAGYRPMQSELSSVSDAVYEIGAFPNWSGVFGITAPEPDAISGRLAIAATWTSLLAQSNAWTSYVKSQEGLAWKAALEVVDNLKPAFQLAVTASPSLATSYPALMHLLGAAKVVAKRAVSTKKRNAAAAVAAAGATAAVAPVASGTAAGGAAAPAVAAANATAAVRTVTVTG